MLGTQSDRCIPLPGTAARDSAQQGDGGLGRISQPRSCTLSDRGSAESVDIEGGAVSEGEEFLSFADGVQGFAEVLLGSAFIGEAGMGGIERQCDRCRMEGVYRKLQAARAGRRFHVV